MNSKNCITVKTELIQSLVIEVKFGEVINVFVAMNLLSKQLRST